MALGTLRGWREGCNVPSSLKESCGLLRPLCAAKLNHSSCCDHWALDSFVGSFLERPGFSSPLLTLLPPWVPTKTHTLSRPAWKDNFWFQGAFGWGHLAVRAHGKAWLRDDGKGYQPAHPFSSSLPAHSDSCTKCLSEADSQKSANCKPPSDPGASGTALAGHTQAGLLHQSIFAGCSLKILHTGGLLEHVPNIRGKEECKVHQNEAAEVGHGCLVAAVVYSTQNLLPFAPISEADFVVLHLTSS